MKIGRKLFKIALLKDKNHPGKVLQAAMVGDTFCHIQCNPIRTIYRHKCRKQRGITKVVKAAWKLKISYLLLFTNLLKSEVKDTCCQITTVLSVKL